MPLYDYRCTTCGKVTEVRHGFDEPFSGACPHCGGALKRVFNPAPVVFKGSGFYVTDSRKRSPGGETKSDPAGDAAKADAKSDSATSDSAKRDAPKSDSAKSDAAKSDSTKSDSPQKNPAA